jgi:hypothetical protein
MIPTIAYAPKKIIDNKDNFFLTNDLRKKHIKMKVIDNCCKYAIGPEVSDHSALVARAVSVYGRIFLTSKIPTKYL